MFGPETQAANCARDEFVVTLCPVCSPSSLTLSKQSDPFYLNPFKAIELNFQSLKGRL